MKYVYPVFIAENNNDYLVFVPDFDIYTQGSSMINAIEMARDAIGLKGVSYEDNKEALPEPSTYDEAIEIAKKDTEVYDYTKGILTMVDVNFIQYRRRLNNKMVRRNVTLPSWLNQEAETAKINVSKVLQEALMKKLG